MVIVVEEITHVPVIKSSMNSRQSTIKQSSTPNPFDRGARTLAPATIPTFRIFNPSVRARENTATLLIMPRPVVKSTLSRLCQLARVNNDIRYMKTRIFPPFYSSPRRLTAGNDRGKMEIKFSCYYGKPGG